MSAHGERDAGLVPAPFDVHRELKGFWASDLCRDLQAHPVVEIAGGRQCTYLAAISPGGTEAEIRRQLVDHLRDGVASAQELRLALMRTMRGVDPRPHCLAATLAQGSDLLVAAVQGATVVLVRDGRLIERTLDTGRFALRPGDRIGLLCARLDPLVQDADELARVISAGELHSCAVTLVEIGHLRGGTQLSAVVAEVDDPDDTEEDRPEVLGVDLGDLLAGLAPALDRHRGTPTPRPRSRRRSPAVVRVEATLPPAAETPSDDHASSEDARAADVTEADAPPRPPDLDWMPTLPPTPLDPPTPSPHRAGGWLGGLALGALMLLALTTWLLGGLP